MPAEGFSNLSLRSEVVDELREAVEAGKLRRFAVRSVPHAFELGARRLLEEANFLEEANRQPAGPVA